MKETILVVDDEAEIRMMVKQALSQYHVVSAADANEAFDILDEQTVDLCVVDVMMPGTDGFTLCKEIKTFYHKPVIMLTARSEMNDKRQAFLAGTDDYLTKPFIPEELAFRVQAVLRRYGGAAKLELGNVILDATSFEVTINNEIAYLPLKEFELLKYLIEISPKVADRSELIDAVWGFDFDGDVRTVDVHVKRLRQRLEALGADIHITTVRGVGYKVQHV